MKEAKKAVDEISRITEVESYQINDFVENDEFDFITTSAAKICDTKASFVNVVISDEQKYLSQCGIEIKNTGKVDSFSAYIINNPQEMLIIEDVQKDPRFKDHELSQLNFKVNFFAGIPLVSENGFPLGTLSVLDDTPKKLDNDQILFLKKLAKQAVSLLELRRSKGKVDELKESLKKSKFILSHTEETNKIGTWELDIASGETKWSKVVYKIHEVPLDFNHNEAKGIEFYHPDYRSLIIEALQSAIKKEETFDVECILITAKGNQKWVRSTGKKVGSKVMGSFQDITKIKESELKFKSIFNSTFSFIGFLDTDGILLEVNNTALDMARLKSEEVIGKYFWDCYWWQISKKAQNELKKHFQKALLGKPVSYEVDVWISNKTPITILFSLKPILDESGNVIYIVPEGRPIQEIVESKKKYKSVLEGTNVGTWEWNVQTGETVFNERWAEIVGYTLEELAPININTWLNLAHPDDLEESERRLNDCFEKKSEFYEFEARMKHKKGHWIWVLDRGKVFDWTDDGKPLMMYGTHQDISERKIREEALRISEEAFRGNFENAGIGMALLDENGKWLKVNSNVCLTVGYTQEELMELTFQDITHPEDLNTDLELLQELVEGKRENYQMEKRYFHKNGHVVYILLAVSSVRDKEGKVLYFISQIVDISERKRAEIELKNLLVENRALMDATTEVAIISTDVSGKVVKTNTGTKNILGYTIKEILGENINELLFLEDEWREITSDLTNDSLKDENIEELLIALSNHPNYMTREWTFKRKDGTLLHVLLSITEVLLGDKTNGYLFAATDISYMKSIQDQLKQKNEELEQFAYVAAHDLKEPLRGITTYLSVLQKRYSEILDERANDYIVKAYENADRLKNLITDILDFSKTGAIGDEEVDLNRLVDSIIANYENDKSFSEIRFFRSELPTIKGDTSSFVQLFTNLIDNGIKYQPKDNIPEIKINASEDEKSYIFRIADNGIGIDPDHQEKVFEIFKRLHANSAYSGTGIGLATCKKIVAAYGGDIWFEKNNPNGTLFIFTIPKQ